MFLEEHVLYILEVSAVAWGGAFLVFLLAHGPILFAPRADSGL